MNFEDMALLCRVEEDSDLFNPRFHDWLANHMAMWYRFAEAADRVRAKGVRNYSAFVIVNVLRYRADLEGQKFAMTNTFVPDLARLYNLGFPEFFNVSTRKKEK